MKRLSLLIAACSPMFAVAQQPEAAKPVEPPKEAPYVVPLDLVLPSLTPRNVGPTSMGGRVSDIAVYEKEPRIFYVASASGGLWKTENAGLTFVPVFDKESTVSLGAVAVSQKNPDVVWLGTGEASSRNSVAWGDGVYRSDDGGKTWRHMGLTETRHISKVVIDPRNPDVVYVAAMGRLWGPNPERGLYKTTDGGKTWKRILHVDDKTGVVDLCLNPRNPDTMLATTWQRLRKPYDFLNGGPGGGLWKSTDGGNRWRKITKGLPPGPFGRIGVCHYKSDPNWVVATVEYKKPKPPEEKKPEPPESEEAGFDGEEQQPAAQEPKKEEQKPAPTPVPPAPAAPQKEPVIDPKDPQNGLYISKDGGESWTYTNGLNPRPFYFSTPRFDPNDNKRIFIPAVSLHFSVDAGKTFKAMPTNVHVDHHAMWINPADSNHMMIGQDGGVGQTRDGGKTWQMLNTLPLGQYYAVAFDMRKPYWVYGGLQDNGSWATPTQTRRSGPAYFNSYSVSGGDGFYVQVDPSDWRTVYSESQGGAIVRTDQVTGQRRSIRPRPPQGERYRFNWNTPIHLSPHNPGVVYIGGNKLFRSLNKGNDWRPISPDLTTNDPLKQQVGKAAATPDIDSGAERHCTITTISESPVKQGLIWAGTDDGNLQFSRDDGASWSNVVGNIAGLPKNTWCSRVTASKYVEGRAYATFDGHREDDFKPYVYVTEDLGKTWTSLSAGLPDYDPLYVIREGDQNPDLLFLGSELSLRVSLDRGKTWGRVRSGFPTVAVHDVVVHPREQELVIGTHGRAIWTMNVAGLEALTLEAVKKDVVVGKPQTVLLMGRTESGGGQGEGLWTAKNTQPGTEIVVFLKTEAKSDLKVTLTDPSNGNTRELTGGKKAGLNVIAWDGRIKGALAEPGVYRVSVMVDGKEFVTSVRVESVTLDW